MSGDDKEKKEEIKKQDLKQNELEIEDLEKVSGGCMEEERGERAKPGV